MKSPATIHLHIEELVLHGFAPGDRHRIGAAVEAELARRLSQEPLPSTLKQNHVVDRVEGGAFSVARGAKPAAVGVQIAGAIHGGLNR